ncbi:mitochondrial enolase superfamily member 1 [Grus japonensis]|uniref:Mitochondrial enolase superfamily member 1 n=1 Tax=Grus japonensis TaxID=30415 RepID=A0ABC9W501_GRUJA
MLRELAEVLTKPLSIIYQQSWLTGEVLVDWKLANVMSIYNKSWKEDPGNYRPVSLTLVPGKVMEQIVLGAIMQHIQHNQVIRPSQYGFMKGKSCLTNLISFYDKMTHLMDEGEAVDVVYLSVLGLALGSEQPHAMLQAWGRVAGRLPSGKRTGGVGRQPAAYEPAEYEPAVCPGGQEGQQHPGLI